jgi:hypothetical protein
VVPEYVPAGQPVQAPTLPDPDAALYVPGKQSVQWSEFEGDQLPGPQAVQLVEADVE